MTFDNAQIVKLAKKGYILALTDKDNHVIAVGAFSNQDDAERAAKLAHDITTATEPRKETVDEMINGLNAMIDDLYQQCLAEDKSAKKSRRKKH